MRHCLGLVEAGERVEWGVGGRSVSQVLGVSYRQGAGAIRAVSHSPWEEDGEKHEQSGQGLLRGYPGLRAQGSFPTGPLPQGNFHLPLPGYTGLLAVSSLGFILKRLFCSVADSLGLSTKAEETQKDKPEHWRAGSPPQQQGKSTPSVPSPHMAASC